MKNKIIKILLIVIAFFFQISAYAAEFDYSRCQKNYTTDNSNPNDWCAGYVSRRLFGDNEVTQSVAELQGLLAKNGWSIVSDSTGLYGGSNSCDKSSGRKYSCMHDDIASQAEPGDVVLFWNKEENRFVHSGIINEDTEKFDYKPSTGSAYPIKIGQLLGCYILAKDNGTKTPTGFALYRKTKEEVPPKGMIEIYKYDNSTSDHTPIGGATFTITGPNNFNRSLSTNGSGYISIPFLDEGTYTIQETAAPAGYNLNSTKYSVTINSKDKSGLLNNVYMGYAIDASEYETIYSDIKNIYGTNLTAAFDHYINYGAKEDRLGSYNFRPSEYLANRPDIITYGWNVMDSDKQSNIFKNVLNLYAAYHYSLNGVYENSMGRDISYYKGLPAGVNHNNSISVQVAVPDTPSVKYGGLKIKKVLDKRGVTLTEDYSGFKFDIYDSTGTTKITTVTTNSNGYACYGYSDNANCSGTYSLVAGTSYVIKETMDTSKLNYTWTDQTKFVSATIVADTGKEVSYTNALEKYCLKVKKVDIDNTSTTIDGVTFGLFTSNSSSATAIKSGSTSGGIVTFSDLTKPSSYYVKETETTTSYFNDNSSFSGPYTPTQMTYNSSTNTFSCPSNAYTITLSDLHKRYCFKVKKTDAVTGLGLKGATFTAVNGGTTLTATSDSDGIATFFTGTNSGNFTVTETKAPTGYRIDSSVSKTITPIVLDESKTKSTTPSDCNDTRYSSSNSFVYTDSKYLINWYKKTESDTFAIGAKFTVTKSGSSALLKFSAKESINDGTNTKSCYKQDDNGSITDLVTDDKGEICVYNIASGDYTVTEILPPEGHTFGSNTEKVKNITASTKFNTNTVFTNQPTQFEFTKTVAGSYSNSNKLERTKIINQLKNLRFNIKNNNGNILQFKLVNGVYEYAGNEIDPKNGTGISNLQLQTEVESEFTMKFIVKHLPKGTYTIEEVDNDGCKTSLGNNCLGNGFYLEKPIKFEVYNTYASVSKTTMTNTMTQFTFTKNDIYSYFDAKDKVKFEDQEEIEAFDKITFKLKNSEGQYLKLKSLGNVGDCTNENSYSEYYYDPTDEGDGSTGTELHTCGGHIKINNLCRDTTYVVEETAVPDGTVFILPSTHPTVTVTIPKEGSASTNSNNKVTISDTPTRVVIQKKDNRTNSNIKEGDPYLEQARFKVYRCINKNISKCTYESSTKEAIKFEDLKEIENDKEDPSEKVYKAMSTTDVNNGNKYVTNLKLNSNGKLILRYLPAGYKYVVVEENAPDGYYNLDTPLNEANIEPSKSTVNISYPFTNYPTIIKFKKEDVYKYYKASDVDKLNSSTKIFDSMTFVLRDENGSIVNLTKTQDGEYRYIDINGKASGTVNEIHTKNGELLITHLYRNKTYYIEETKADTEGNFILPNNIDNTSLVESKAGNLKNNKHPIVKYNIPNKLPDTDSLNAAPSSLTELIQNLPTRVVFEKRDAKTGELIDDLQNEDTMYSGVLTTFNVYQCKKSVTTCTKNNGTLIYFEDRTYINDLTKDITVVVPPVLTYKYSKLNESAGMVKDLHTDRGVLVLAYLPDTYKYVLVETVAPNGYYNPTQLENETEFTVEDTTLSNGKTYETLTEKVLNTPTEIHFIKSDLYNYYNSSDLAKLSSDEKIFDTMRFVLRDKDGKKLKLKCAEDYNYKSSTNGKCTTGQYRYLPYKSSENKTEELQTIDGTFMISHLYRGETYYIEEIKADDEGNFILPDYMKYDDLPFDNKGHPVVKYVLPENEPPTAESITEEIKNVPTRVVFEKRDSKYGYLIPDETTTFNVYQCNMKEESCTPENGTLVYFEQRKIIDNDDEDYGKEVYKYSKLNSNKNAVTDLHPYKGDLILRYLPDTYKYVLVETVSPLNYVLPEGERAYTEFTISKTTVKVDEVDVPNKPTSLLIRKYNNEGELLPGAEFVIYKVTNYDENRTPENQEKVALKLKTIRDGLYDAREKTDTNIIKTCKDEEYQKCNEINITLTHDDYIDTWTNFKENSVNQDRERVEIKEGEALIQYLEYNNYYVIEEVKAPNGYSLPEKKEDRFHIVHIVMESDVIDTNKHFINKPTPFKFYKFDEYNNPLDGAKFKLQKLDDNKKYNDISVSLEIIDDEYYYKVDPNSENLLMETINGEATVYYLEEGQYRILEVEPADGYELPKKTINVATFFVDSNGNVYGNSIITNKKPTETTTYNPTAYAELIVNVQTGQERIKYGIIIGSILIIISSLIVYQNKKKDKKEGNNEKTKEKK